MAEEAKHQYEGCKVVQHCWDGLSTVSYNNTDGSVADVQTQVCRHCPARRERRTVMRVEYRNIEDSGWQIK
jgi:hypothetical protein